MLKFRADLRSALAPLAAPVQATLFEGRVARVHQPGDGLRYEWGQEFRSQEELQRVASQLPGKPVTMLHPAGLISEGATARVVGVIASARVDGDHAIATIVVADPDVLPLITGEDGIHELSLGYACRADDEGWQHDTVVDHLAIVPKARCGESCSLRADAIAEPVCCDACAGQRKRRPRPVTEAERAALPPVPLLRDYFEVILDGRLPTLVRDTATGTWKVEVGEPHDDAKLKAHARAALGTDEFAVPEERKFPIHDPEHVRAAMSRFGQAEGLTADQKRAAYHRILSAAKYFGVDSTGFQEEWGGRLDESTCTCKNHAVHLTEVTEPIMDELQKQLSAALTAQAAEKARADAAEAALAAAKADADKIEAERDNARADAAAQKSRADAAEAATAEQVQKAHLDAQSNLDARVASRVSLLTTANAVLGTADDKGQPIDRSAMSDRDIKTAIVKHVDGLDVPEGKSEAYLDGMYEGALKRHADGRTSRTDAVVTIHQMRQDGAQRPSRGADLEREALANLNRQTAEAYLASQE